MEIWKKIQGYSNYEVSNLGRVKSLNSNKILNQYESESGYLNVWLYNQGKRKGFRVHRLVAQEFIKKASNNLEVNHIDSNKKNNSIFNLEWCTRGENIKHSFDNGYRKNNLRKLIEANSKKVIDLFTGIFYDSMSEACRVTNSNLKREQARNYYNCKTLRFKYI
jgi:hypothetical protein